MSLNSSGTSIKIVNAQFKKLGYGYTESNSTIAAADALRLAIEEFILSNEFKQLTTISLYGALDLKLEFLAHTTL